MASKMKFSPITSEDVERSFSLYKHILSDRRTHMTPEHMEQYIGAQCVVMEIARSAVDEGRRANTDELRSDMSMLMCMCLRGSRSAPGQLQQPVP
ncbi:Uncharacterized protein FWK35_00033596 [Aphis craccivora]|uniref:Uncharacterized protein n=1 Tax=Aphis craccivora TaxID=307492 RepID=A0A6G0W0Q8_APHCR|nr:Uncharacterized protein FWK35_00033596 [Aphis craccivora]